MEHREQYKGHSITAWTTEIRKKWYWFYTIDDEAMIRSDDPPQLSEQATLDDAIAKARVRVDSYPKDQRPFVTGR
jgi:hypothetical protein